MEEGGGTREEKRGRLGFRGAEGALVVARGRWERGPRGGGGRATPLAFGEATVTKDKVGPGVSERGERGGGAAGCCALRGRGTGPAHWLAWLPPVLFFFFLKTLFLFYFLF